MRRGDGALSQIADSRKIGTDVCRTDTPTGPLIVTGRPVSALGAGEGDLLMSAAVTMGIRHTEALRQNIAGLVGLDEITVTPGGPGQADARLTLGKYLTPRLYLSYGAGLVQSAVDTMRLRYDINRWLALEAEQGRGAGADLLYQIER
jgi:translocation and assembly module TamB